MYSPVTISKASGGSGEYVIQGGGIPPPCASAMKLAMTVVTKKMDTQRCVCRIHVFQFTADLSKNSARNAMRAAPR